MLKPRKSWRTQQDSNLRPLPSEGLCNDRNEPFSAFGVLQTAVQAHIKPFFERFFTGMTPESFSNPDRAIRAAMGV